MMTKNELKEWLDAIPEGDDSIAIAEDGMRLVSYSSSLPVVCRIDLDQSPYRGNYLEIGGIRIDDDE